MGDSFTVLKCFTNLFSYEKNIDNTFYKDSNHMGNQCASENKQTAIA